MPELPEVETVKNVLSAWCTNLRIESVEIKYPKIIKTPNFPLAGKTIKEIKRQGKWLIFCLNEGFILSHLRMEGKYFFQEESRGKHDLVVFSFYDQAKKLIYNDSRRFGEMLYVDDLQNSKISTLGIDPLQTDGAQLKKIMNNINMPLKVFLLDQQRIAGIGNIYADEIAFASGVDPRINITKLKNNEYDKMALAMKKVLFQAIADGGSTISSFHFADGASGNFQTKLNVYGRKGKECPICGNIIEKVMFRGRGTHFCRHCQRLS